MPKGLHLKIKLSSFTPPVLSVIGGINNYIHPHLSFPVHLLACSGFSQHSETFGNNQFRRPEPHRNTPFLPSSGFSSATQGQGFGTALLQKYFCCSSSMIFDCSLIFDCSFSKCSFSCTHPGLFSCFSFPVLLLAL